MNATYNSTASYTIKEKKEKEKNLEEEKERGAAAVFRH